MPDRSTKVRWSQLKVGVVALTAFLILSLLIFLLTSSMNLFQRDRDAAHLHGRRVRHDRQHAGAAERHHHRLGGQGEPEQLARSQARRGIRHEGGCRNTCRRSRWIRWRQSRAANLLGDKFINITKGQRPAARPGRRRNQAPSGAGHSGIDGAERQPAGNVPDHRGARGQPAGRGRSGQGQHRQAAEGRGALRPAERHRARRARSCWPTCAPATARSAS